MDASEGYKTFIAIKLSEVSFRPALEDWGKDYTGEQISRIISGAQRSVKKYWCLVQAIIWILFHLISFSLYPSDHILKEKNYHLNFLLQLKLAAVLDGVNKCEKRLDHSLIQPD